VPIVNLREEYLDKGKTKMAAKVDERGAGAGSLPSHGEQAHLKADLDWPPAVIAGAYRTGVLAVRSLVRRKVHATLFDCDQSMPGFKSVYGPARLCPDPDLEPDTWLRFMLNLAREYKQRPVLIASADQFVTAISKYADILESHYIFSSGMALHGALAEKRTQYKLAWEHGMPMPRTEFVSCLEEVQAFGRGAAFPCVVKPNHFREWQRFPVDHPLSYQKVAVVNDASQLCETYKSASTVTPEVILQEMIQGDDSVKSVYLSCYDSQGRRIANAMFRELRCDPMYFGPASVTEPFFDQEVDGICDNFLKSMRYSGLCEIELKRDTRDGQVKLIEANPRLTGGGDAAPYAGVDLCWVHYLDLIGRTAAPVSPSSRHFRHIVLRADARAVPAYLRAGAITWREVLRSYGGPKAYYDLEWRDWRYSLETLYVTAGAFVSRMLRG
jgi:predicted ATP-grasp superfamily ATP-dependent carboligase